MTRLGLTAAELATETGFNIWKTYRITQKPERARVADFVVVDETLSRLERAAAGGPTLADRLAAMAEAES